MKKSYFISALIILLSLKSLSQTTATNFNCDDCHAINHDLFSELNEGKIIVIAWVMPCGGCISGALAGYSAAESFATSNPGQVLFYLVDDYANTSCSSLGGWGDNNGMTNAVPFKNALIDMSNYGTDGMPKVIVLGGNNHTVYYNQNNSAINQTGVTTAINTALTSLLQSSVDESENNMNVLKVFPNPSYDLVKINLESLGAILENNINVILTNNLGETVKEIFSGKYNENQKEIIFSTAEFSNGTYFISLKESKNLNIEIVVSH